MRALVFQSLPASPPPSHACALLRPRARSPPSDPPLSIRLPGAVSASQQSRGWVHYAIHRPEPPRRHLRRVHRRLPHAPSPPRVSRACFSNRSEPRASAAAFSTPPPIASAAAMPPRISGFRLGDPSPPPSPPPPLADAPVDTFSSTDHPNRTHRRRPRTTASRLSPTPPTRPTTRASATVPG